MMSEIMRPERILYFLQPGRLVCADAKNEHSGLILDIILSVFVFNMLCLTLWLVVLVKSFVTFRLPVS